MIKKFIFNGWYYPSISRSISGYSGKEYFTKTVWLHKIGGWGKFTQYLPYVSIKCLIRKDNKRLYKQFVLDAIHKHPEMKIQKDWYDDSGYIEEPKKDTDNFTWSVYTYRTIFLNKQIYIGSIEEAYRLTDLCYLQGTPENSSVVSIGLNPIEEKWYGWSHRAKYGFGIGSNVKEGDIAYEQSKGEWTANTMEDAKQMALDFAEGIS